MFFFKRLTILNLNLLKNIDLKHVPNSITFYQFSLKYANHIFNKFKLILNHLLIYFILFLKETT